ncbi:hypothetical protein ZWY2020_033529 [Hordeum vulgare]|nr:hypothetical protein ZWY2020_033529 [Hordeum vulgare]
MASMLSRASLYDEERDYDEMVRRFNTFKEAAFRVDRVNKANLPYTLKLSQYADGKLAELTCNRCFGREPPPDPADYREEVAPGEVGSVAPCEPGSHGRHPVGASREALRMHHASSDRRSAVAQAGRRVATTVAYVRLRQQLVLLDQRWACARRLLLDQRR